MMFWLLLILILSAFILLVVWLDLLGYAKGTFKRWKLYRTIPLSKTVPSHWLLGHIPALSKDNEAFWTRVNAMSKAGEDHPGIEKYYIGPFVDVAILHPKHIPFFLKEPKSEEYGVLLPWLGEGLLIAGSDKWSRNRRLLTPAFHYSILKTYISIYNSCVSELLTKWQKSAIQQESVNVFQSVSSMSLDIILQCAFSFKSNCQSEKSQHPYIIACAGLSQHCSERFLHPLYWYDWIYWHTSHGKKMKGLCDTVHRHAEKVISERKVVLAAQGETSSLEKHSSQQGSRHIDFLDILLLAKDEGGEGMSDLEIRNEVDTFMFEGHDTTTSGMSWTLYCLAKHPKHQDKVREEVRNVLKEREWLEYDDLKHLNYTMWCIKEAMRQFPPVYTYARNATKEINLGKCTVPEGATVDLSAFQIHHNGTVWEDPMKYDPLRFQPENMAKHGPYDYIPFSAGMRNCIGQNFAMNELKVVIAMIVARFQLKLDPHHSVEVRTHLILKAKNDIKLVLEPLVS